MIKAALKAITQKQEFVLCAILVAICTVFAIIAPFFLSAYNIGNLLRAVSMIVIVACGGTLLMMTANFDLSTGGNLIFSNIIFAMTCLAGVPVVFALGIAILCGCMIGAINGILVTRFSVTPFIATLGTWFIFKGIAKAITDNNEIKAGLPKSFDFLGQGQLGPVPMPVVILVVIVVIFLFLERKTLLGKYSMAIGGNPAAAYLSGINSDKIVFLLFTITGGLAGLAGSIAASRIGSGNPRIGDGFEFDVIIAIILGGTRLAGGRGTILGTLIAALIVAAIGSGLNMLGMLSFWQKVLKGVILVLAILLNEKLRK
ncbi:MAG: ABC transporter permease [bacterium]|nr:ABC transporter permease [bacterium]